MKAVIYAAGRGVRLGADSPKVLVEFGGRSLLEWHAVRLAECGVCEVLIVVGHLREQIEATLPVIGKRHDVRFRAITNERFTEGSILSLAVSLPELEQSSEPVLLMDADVLYPTAILERLIRSLLVRISQPTGKPTDVVSVISRAGFFIQQYRCEQSLSRRQIAVKFAFAFWTMQVREITHSGDEKTGRNERRMTIRAFARRYFQNWFQTKHLRLF